MRLLVCVFLLLCGQHLFAHPMPNSIVSLSILDHSIKGEAKMPMLELASALQQTRIDTIDPAYFQQHIRALSGDRQWTTTIDSIRMTTDTDPNVGRYQEVLVYFEMTPPDPALLRDFNFRYNAIIHEVVTHKILVFVKQDWKNGIQNGEQIGIIKMDTRSGKVFPMYINLEHGTYWTGFKNMVMLGIEHIREGTDHLLFLLALMLPAADRIKRLIQIVTAFTIGHSISLLCGTLGWIVIPSQWVEIAITFTILISAIHIIRPIFKGKEAWIAITFGFIHGLAFASALNNLDLVPTEMALSILGFNIGIETMQLFVLLCTVPWLLLINNVWIKYLGGVIAIIASLGWMIERISNEPNIISAQIEQIQGKWFILVLAIMAIIAYGTRWVRTRSLS
ncbi:HupE/UreJ family protein [[Flexibacter] sp. ATCC 35208]|uniref:HupE/UreJ family protein n=1 Tax=[Flexibacter] sp. ATCC 35208 TaxID=1936242 RepID=UPI0009D4A0FD|nr:HupE/UreJ family protein [[Flexibacter] sp. ATCC 35208]OMP78568.1 hypothetical protein BW716_13895 [[Flexibacter] sp. ATCC 35208]